MAVDLKKIGTYIKQKRQQCGLTQSQLAELSALSNTHISRLETGESTMSLESLLNLCEALKTTPNYLLFGQYTQTGEAFADSLKDRELSQDELEFLLEMAEQFEKRKVNRKE